MVNMLSIIGLKVVRILGYKTKDKRVKKPIISPVFILFSDGETYIQLYEQDYYSYHDCSSSAREIRVVKDKSAYDSLLSWDDLADANSD